MVQVSGRPSTGPKDVLFSKWKDSWNEIKAQVTEEDDLNVYDWEGQQSSAQETVALGVKQWPIQAKNTLYYNIDSCL